MSSPEAQEALRIAEEIVVSHGHWKREDMTLRVQAELDMARALITSEARLGACEEALRKLEPMQQNALKMIERNGFVFENIGAEPGNWQHLAFSLYTDLCEVDSVVSAALNTEEPADE